ncbi:leukocyte cysteine proteinase inhibitor 1-like isoform X2 [Melanotaenia boesemani]|uniref:leukocyte cysteine proteinase inhibitor 1-like isoform X2 n=1 Tax=Melanotaenia boesemani TaxID=1250792 RepID=UPI001C03E7E2|nr:leukocyte cysteine proteinase inhibitor 1-like isoform X2 [Melanotaenia boesemani]
MSANIGMFGTIGEYGETTDATEETQMLCDQVKTAVEEKTGKCVDEFEATKYRPQVVHRNNFLIKVHVGGENYIHLKVFSALPCNDGLIQMVALQQNKTKDDPLEPL